MTFTHYLFTRINLPYKSTTEKPYSNSVVENSEKLCHDPAWLQRRYKYFKEICQPSVLGQSNRNFKWFLLLSYKTPSAQEWDSLEGCQTVYTDWSDRGIARDLILKECKTPFVIGTSLDSDDAISKDFIETVQKNFREMVEIIDVPRGFVVKEGRAYGRRTASVSAFRSLVEKLPNVKTVYDKIHGASHLIAPVNSLDCDARWLQFLHGENLTNKVAIKSQDKGKPFEEIKGQFSL
jgi:hypothetical protein